MPTNVTVTDAEGIVVAGSRHRFLNKLTQDGGQPYSPAGKTVLATVRYEGRPGKVIDETLEDIEVDPITPDADGNNVEWFLEQEMSELLLPFCPERPTQTAPFTVQYRVVEDDFDLDLLRVQVRRPGRAPS